MSADSLEEEMWLGCAGAGAATSPEGRSGLLHRGGFVTHDQRATAARTVPSALHVDQERKQRQTANQRVCLLSPNHSYVQRRGMPVR